MTGSHVQPAMMGTKSGSQKLTRCKIFIWQWDMSLCRSSLIARFVGQTWGPSGADRTQVGPMLALWTLNLGLFESQCRYPIFEISQCNSFKKIIVKIHAISNMASGMLAVQPNRAVSKFMLTNTDLTRTFLWDAGPRYPVIWSRHWNPLKIGYP